MGDSAKLIVLDEMPKSGTRLAGAVVRGLFYRPTGPAPQPDVARVEVRDVVPDLTRLAAYQRLCGSRLGDTVPASWLHVLTFPLQTAVMTAPGFGYPLLGLVHIANTMTLRRPVRSTDRLTLTAEAGETRPHRRGTVVDLVMSASVDGETVWDGVSSYLAKGQRSETSDTSPSKADEVTPSALTPRAQWKLAADLGRRYAAVSGDANPIHLSAATAKAFGFPRTIAHGMWSHARALSAFEGRLPEAYRVEVAFKKPILLPGTVTLRADHEVDRSFAITSTTGDRVHLLGKITDLSSEIFTDSDN